MGVVGWFIETARQYYWLYRTTFLSAHASVLVTYLLSFKNNSWFVVTWCLWPKGKSLTLIHPCSFIFTLMNHMQALLLNLPLIVSVNCLIIGPKKGHKITKITIYKWPEANSALFTIIYGKFKKAENVKAANVANHAKKIMNSCWSF